jgi:hypothetical protein
MVTKTVTRLTVICHSCKHETVKNVLPKGRSR